MLSATMLDGLLHYAHIVQIGGEIYRLKDKRKVGQTGHVQVRDGCVASGFVLLTRRRIVSVRWST